MNDKSLPLIAGLPTKKPPGEDFFLAKVEFHSDDDPDWNDGFCLQGSWDAVSRSLALFVLSDPRSKLCSIKIAQGDNARAALQFHLGEELRYQKQKRVQGPN